MEMHKILKAIMKREKTFAETLANKINVNPASFRRMLRGELDMDIDIFGGALDELGYKIMIVKKEDLI